MIVRSTTPPQVEFVVSSDDEVRQAVRAIHEATGTPWGRTNLNQPAMENATADVIHAMKQILRPCDLKFLAAVRAGRTRRMAIEKVIAGDGHSFPKIEPRLARMADSIGKKLEDFVVADKLRDGALRETWYEAGSTLATISPDELEHLARALMEKEAQAANEYEDAKTVEPETTPSR